MNSSNPYPTIQVAIGTCSLCNGTVVDQCMILSPDNIMRVGLRLCFSCGAHDPDTKIIIMKKREIKPKI